MQEGDLDEEKFDSNICDNSFYSVKEVNDSSDPNMVHPRFIRVDFTYFKLWEGLIFFFLVYILQPV